MPTNRLTANKKQVAKRLAGFHFRVEGGLVKIFQITTPPAGKDEKSIVLLEVNKNTVPSGIMPLKFAPAPDKGITFSSVIVEVTPDEYQKIKASELALPDGWELGDEISKTEAALAVR